MKRSDSDGPPIGYVLLVVSIFLWIVVTLAFGVGLGVLAAVLAIIVVLFLIGIRLLFRWVNKTPLKDP